MNLPNCVFFLYKDFLFLPINPHPFSHCPSFWLFLPDPETKKGVRGLSGSQVPEFRVPEFASVVSNSVRPHRWQPTRLPHPWDSPGKNTGVGCHFLLQCMKVKSESEVAQSCPTPRDPTDCSLPGSSIHGIFQARVLEWGAKRIIEELYLNVISNLQEAKIEVGI